MTWCGVEGHDAIVAQFRRSLQQRRLASSFLFLGPSGVGKRLFATRLAQGLLCDQRDVVELDPCLGCPACLQIAANNHPDVDQVSRPAGKSFIPLELFVGDREHRTQEGLCHRLALKPSSGKRRIAIIDDADHLSVESANCLLKTLEEPPPGSVLILVGTSQQRQLPTIRSRCQIVRFQRLSDEFVRDYVLEKKWAEGSAEAQELVTLAEGSLEQVTQYVGGDWTDFRAALAPRLRDPEDDVPGFSRWVLQFVEQGGSEASVRRDRLRRVVRLCMRFYRQRLLAAPMDEAASATDDGARVDRCLEALVQIDANANLATLIECWIDDLFPPVPRPG